MIYKGDPKGYTPDELKRARCIRRMDSGRDEAIKKFKSDTNKMFPIHEPGTHFKPNPKPHACLNHINLNMQSRLFSRGKLF